MRVPTPQGIDDAHLRPRRYDRHASPASVLLLGAVLLTGLSGLLGHAGNREQTASSEDVALRVDMPAVIRNGDFFEMNLLVQAKSDIKKLQIEVDSSLWHEVTINALVPAPDKESSDDRSYTFSYGSLAAGQASRVKISAQINPRLVGEVSGRIQVSDSGQPLLTMNRSIRVLP